MDETLDRLRHRDILALCVIALLFLGIIMVQSAAMNITGPKDPAAQSAAALPHWQWTLLGTRHLMYALVAIVTFFIVGHIDYANFYRRSIWKSPIVWFVILAVLACALVLVPHVGIEKNGARRWLPLAFVQVQPSELGKWAVVLFLAWWLTARPVDLNRFRNFILTLVPIGMICLLIVIQDFGTAALIGLCAFTMLLAGRIKWWHLAIIIPPALAAAAVFTMGESYRRRRLLSFMDPWAAPQREGYHMIQSLLSFATGGVYGRGLGNGIQKLGYLPEDTTDFIFAVICEELGLCGAILTIALYLGILFVAWQIIKQQRDNFGRLLAFGIGSMIGLQAAINIAVATVSVPTKGLSLPLVSAGGSGLVITCGALGLLYSIARHKHREVGADVTTDVGAASAAGLDPIVPPFTAAEAAPTRSNPDLSLAVQT